MYVQHAVARRGLGDDRRGDLVHGVVRARADGVPAASAAIGLAPLSPGSLAVPVHPVASGIYRIDLLLGLYGSYAALIVPYVAVSILFNTLFLFTGVLRELPIELEESAIIDGAGLWRLVTGPPSPSRDRPSRRC